jgi:cyclopropane fatty-acyl-phospholipid synthase-like methyltransferase
MHQRQKVQRYFDRIAHLYDYRYASGKNNILTDFIRKTYLKEASRFIKFAAEHCQKNNLKSILDVGCGSGRLELALAETGASRIVGIDFSAKMLAKAHENTASIQAFNNRIEFHQCDFRDFETEEKFDAVVALGLFDYLQDPLPALAKMRSYVQHSLIASFPLASDFRTPFRKLFYLLNACPVYFYDREKIDLLSRVSGFSRCEIEDFGRSGIDCLVTFYP